ncbi:VC0807 family protein [Silvimonas sp.]|uniref:VC0807 family protein n=1 Tax=Silvimonas sp. TaxID=2650811 RepID=UPI0028427BCF|nr:VC0807 family protein [Silvimonas sp.]MDR3429417.1 hypothetical protein [Silvimonas sp.]
MSNTTTIAQRPKLRTGLIIEILVNFVLPWLVYRQVEAQWGSHNALLASAIPPVLWSVLELVRHRRLDALSLLVIAGIVLSVGAVALGGSPTLMLMRESLITGAFGLAFLISAGLRRPLIYYLARATVAREKGDAMARFEQYCTDGNGKIARWLIVMSLVWGGGLLAEMALRLWLAQTLSIERFLLISPWLSYGIYAALGGWTWWYRRQLRNRHQRQEAGTLAQVQP